MTTATTTTKGKDMKKATRATVKSFVKKNRSDLLIKVGSRFDGMTDCVEEVKSEFTPALDVGTGYNFDGEEFDRTNKNNLGIQGLWLVLGGRDFVSWFETESHVGLNVYYSCGEFWIAGEK